MIYTVVYWKENGGVKAMTSNKVRAKIVDEYTAGKVA